MWKQTKNTMKPQERRLDAHIVTCWVSKVSVEYEKQIG